MILHPRDWFSYGDQIYVFGYDNTGEAQVVKIEPFESYYTELTKNSRNASQARKFSPINPTLTWDVFDKPPGNDGRYGQPKPGWGWRLDKSNKILSIFKAGNIQPYMPIMINNVLASEDMNYAAVHQISPVKDINNYVEPGTRMYFDIEVYSETDNFTDPNDETSHISVITIVFARKEDEVAGHVITVKKASYDNVFIHVVEDEKSLLEKFYELWLAYQPEEVIHYNGYDFDIPFIINRTRKHKLEVPDLGFLDYGTTELKTRKIKFAVRSQPKIEEIWFTPGVKNIDFLFFFKRFYPEISYYKLDEVAQKFLNRGKTGLTISRMFEILAGGTEEEMKEVIHYAYIDTYLLYELDKKLRIIDTLVSAANSLRVTIEQLLTMSDIKLMRSIIYNFEHTILVEKLELKGNSFSSSFSTRGFLQKIKTGIYYDLKLFDYSKTIVETLSGSVYSDLLRERLKDAPNGIASKLLSSNYFPGNSYQKVIDLISGLIPKKSQFSLFEPVRQQARENNIVGITEYFIYSLVDIDIPSTFVQNDKIRFVIDNTNYSLFDDEKKFHHYGKSPITRQPFLLMKDYLEEYYKNAIRGYYIPLIETIFETEIPLLKISLRVKPSHRYKNRDSVEYRVAVMAEKIFTITSWIIVDYYRISQGVDSIYICKNKDDQPPPEIINLDWYRFEMSRVREVAMKMYRNVRHLENK